MEKLGLRGMPRSFATPSKQDSWPTDGVTLQAAPHTRSSF